MFSNCIERLGHKKNKNKKNKNKTKQQQTNKQTKKNQGKNKQIKNGNNSTHHELLRGMDTKEILNSPPDKFLIPVNQIYLYATLPPRGLCRI